jgi:hypothetical protein
MSRRRWTVAGFVAVLSASPAVVRPFSGDESRTHATTRNSDAADVSDTLSVSLAGAGTFSGTESPAVVAPGDQVDPAISGHVALRVNGATGAEMRVRVCADP